MKKQHLVLFWIVFVLTAALSGALFLLGRINLPGWLLWLGALAAWAVLRLRPLSGRGFGWRLLVFCAAAAVLGLAFRLGGPRVQLVPAVAHPNPQVTGEITLAQGRLTGVYTADGAVEVYAGIPYAQPPVGDLRWKEPQPPLPWEGVRACDTFAPMSMQKRNSPLFTSLADLAVYHKFRPKLWGNTLEPMSEDSLYLNIWKPAGDRADLPVLVYVHGGSLTTGQPSYGEYNGETLARHGVLVVNFGYRLNVFGYYANLALAEESPNGTTGNYGLLDQIQALRWVQENIRSFGGDPDNVTLAGESAGASSVNALCVSPLSQGLFTRAMAASSGILAKVPYHTFRSMEQALADNAGLPAEQNAPTLAQLRALPAETLVNTGCDNSAMTVDGYAITEQPWETYARGANHETALLQGFNAHEADVFSLTVRVDEADYVEKLRPLYGQWAAQAAALVPPRAQDAAYRYVIDPGGTAKGAYDQAVSAAWFHYSHYRWAALLEGRPVYTYYFDKDNRSLGCNHAGELPYFYGNLDRHAFLYDESDRALSEMIVQYYVNYIKTGDPNGPGLPLWQTAAQAPGRVLELGEQVQMIPDPSLELYPLLDQYQDSLAQEDEAAP